MEKRNYKKELKQFYGVSSRKVELVDVPEMNYLMVDGQGNPNSAQSYSEAIEALYALSYTLKFMVKKGELAIDYGVMPLQCLWWADDMSAFVDDRKDEWKWTAMIMQPELITANMVAMACEQVAKKKDPVALPLVRFAPFTEGLAAQITHIGPFSEEGPTIARVHDFIAAHGYKRSGKHHEIYLSDIRRAAPEKWKTIIRQPLT